MEAVSDCTGPCSLCLSKDREVNVRRHVRFHSVTCSSMPGKEQTHHNSQFNYHHYHNASKPLGDRHHNKWHKHPDLDHLQPNTTCLVRFAAGWFDRELS